jgi:hypothetical protein
VATPSDHIHEFEPAIGVLGEPAKYCPGCGAWTINGVLVQPKGEGDEPES